jgi:hypothetical protein
MSSSGNSTSPLTRKLGIDGDQVFTVRNAPPGFAELLGDIGDAVWQQSLMAPLDVIVAFYSQRVALMKEWPKLTAPMQPAGSIWVAWPKPASGVPTDLTEDVLRARLLPTGWVDDKACAIDDTWSALQFTKRKETRRPKDAKKR